MRCCPPAGTAGHHNSLAEMAFQTLAKAVTAAGLDSIRPLPDRCESDAVDRSLCSGIREIPENKAVYKMDTRCFNTKLLTVLDRLPNGGSRGKFAFLFLVWRFAHVTP